MQLFIASDTVAIIQVQVAAVVAEQSFVVAELCAVVTVDLSDLIDSVSVLLLKLDFISFYQIDFKNHKENGFIGLYTLHYIFINVYSFRGLSLIIYKKH